MNRYYSDTTPKGNSSVSTVSKEHADSMALAMDENGCVNCYQ